MLFIWKVVKTVYFKHALGLRTAESLAHYNIVDTKITL